MGSFLEPENYSRKDVEKALQMINIAAQSRGMFAKAFLDQTGLQPEDAEMRYGEVVKDGHRMFKVWFVRKEEAIELDCLRQLVVDLANAGTPDEVAECICQARDICGVGEGE